MASGTETQVEAGAKRSRPPLYEQFLEKRGWIEIALACLSFLVYVPTLSFGFVYDDREIVLRNKFLESWRYLAHDFASNLWSNMGSAGSMYYRPLYLSWLRLNYSAFGDKAWGWHLTNAALHAVVTVLVFRLAWRLLNDRRQALIAALFFALHPVHVESVAWISAIVDPLLSIFFIASFLCYLHWRDQRKSSAWMGASLLFAVLTMLTKEPGITLPAVVFAYAWIFADAATQGIGSRFRTAASQATPFVLVAIAYLAVRHAVLSTVTSAGSTSTTAFLTMPGLLLFYLRLLAWPFGYSLFYDRHLVQRVGFGDFVIPLLLLSAIAGGLALLLRHGKKEKEGAFSLAFGLLVLSPVLWVRWFNAYDFVHGRYLYLPSAGFALLFAVALSKLSGVSKPRSDPKPQMIIVALIAAVLLIGNVTAQPYWASDLLLWSHSLDTAPRNRVVLNNLGASMGERNEFKTALTLLTEAVRQDPDYPDAQGNLGYTLYRMDQLPPAEEHLSRAVQLNPSDARSLLYLGVTHFKVGRLEDAEAELRRSLQLDPEARGAHLALSMVLEKRGELAQAIQETQAELSKFPDEAKLNDRMKELRDRR